MSFGTGVEMYFLTPEEYKFLFQGLLPRAREAKISNELRGWSWAQPPLQPTYDLKLGLFEIANRYCPTGRDLYLRRVMDVKVKPNQAMVEGAIFHKTLAQAITRAKRLIYQSGVDHFDEVKKSLLEPDCDLPDGLTEEARKHLTQKVNILWKFEAEKIVSRVEEVLSKQPHISEDSLVFKAIPVVVEQKLDGSYLGLSSHLSVDAIAVFTPLIFDLKFDIKRDFHKLSITGYTLVAEANYEFPIDIGCIAYGEFRDNRLRVNKESFVIDDELRQNFIEERDERSRMIYEEIDPGKPAECYSDCPYRAVCEGNA